MFRMLHSMLLVSLICGVAVADPDAEQLILRYFRDYGQELNNGKFEVLQQSYHPYYPKEVFSVPGGLYGGFDGKVDDEKEKSRYYQRMASIFDINFNSASKEYSYKATRSFYDGEKRRKDLADLDRDSFSQLIDGKKAFAETSFEKYYDNGSNKITSILDQGLHKDDPQVAISPGKLGIPRVDQYGKLMGTSVTAKAMVDLIQSGKYSIFGEMTQEGYIATAEADKTMTFSKLELVFEEKQGDYILRKTRQYRMGSLFDEEDFDDYIITPGGLAVPTKIVRRRYSPFPVSVNGGSLECKVVYEEKVTVLSAEFNTDIPEDTFVPHIPYGYTVYDTTVNPPIQFVAHVLKDSYGKDFFDATLEELGALPEPVSAPISQGLVSDSNEANDVEIVIAEVKPEVKSEVKSEVKPEVKVKWWRMPFRYWILVICLPLGALYGKIRNKKR